MTSTAVSERSLIPARALDPAAHAGGGTAAAGLARWLGLAAAPAFALMALATGPFGSTSPMLCMGGQDIWSPDSMALMYALMSVFHLGPWLKIVQGRP